ncbi:MAG: hypothetical protein AAF633_13905 [Chloroflexota bacterium]
MRVLIFGESYELVADAPFPGEIDFSQFVDAPRSDLKEIWLDPEIQSELVSRLIRFTKVNRPVDSLPQLPDEIAQNLRSELLTHPDKYLVDRDGVDEVEQLLQDFLRPIIYAVIQAHYQSAVEKPDFTAVIETLHAETAWRTAPPKPINLGDQLAELSPIYTLAGPVGYELLIDGVTRYVEDRCCQHPAIPTIEKLTLALGERLYAALF